jgi:hypothetical protein
MYASTPRRRARARRRSLTAARKAAGLAYRRTSCLRDGALDEVPDTRGPGERPGRHPAVPGVPQGQRPSRTAGRHPITARAPNRPATRSTGCRPGPGDPSPGSVRSPVRIRPVQEADQDQGLLLAGGALLQVAEDPRAHRYAQDRLSGLLGVRAGRAGHGYHLPYGQTPPELVLERGATGVQRQAQEGLRRRARHAGRCRGAGRAGTDPERSCVCRTGVFCTPWYFEQRRDPRCTAARPVLRGPGFEDFL